jgi:hypothetical protein
MSDVKVKRVRKVKAVPVVTPPAEWVDPGWICKAADMAARWDGVSPHWIEREVGRLVERIRSYEAFHGPRFDATGRLLRDTELLVGELLAMTAEFRESR